jgi:membrane protein YqaA with SNARE-associated domain
MDAALTYGGLFLHALLAATILPASSEVALAALLHEGWGNPYVLIAIATMGNTAGSAINWTIGRFLLRFRDRRWFPLTPARYEKTRKWFERFGIWSLLLAWLPVVGDPLTVIAGALRVAFVRFLILVVIGKGARYAVIGGGVLWWTAE